MRNPGMERLAGFIMAALAAGALLLSGCSQSSIVGAKVDGESNSGAGEGREESSMPRMDENAVMGKITAIQGDTLTIALAEMPEPAERPGGSENAEGPDGIVPESREMTEGEGPDGNGQMELSLTGGEQEITVTDATTFFINGEEGTLADLKIDDTVTVILGDSETAKSVRSGMNRAFGGGRNDREENESTE